MNRRLKHILKFLIQILHLFYIFIPVTKFFRSFIYHIGIYKIVTIHPAGIHLGSGNMRIPQFINMDLNPQSRADIIAGIYSLKFKKNSIPLIYSSHIFEHIHRYEALQTLRNWLKVLAPGGKLYICVPDMALLCQLYAENVGNYESAEKRVIVDMAAGVLYGGQVNKYDFHFFGYSFESLRSLLLSTGFKNISRFDHDAVASFPNDGGRLAKIDNKLISLNIVAEK
jgi:predicted SAM-dependent methyltransferase